MASGSYSNDNGTIFDDDADSPGVQAPQGGPEPINRESKARRKSTPESHEEWQRLGGDGRIEAAAADLLGLAARVRLIAKPQDQSVLMREAEDFVIEFEHNLRKTFTFSDKMINDASYLLCATLDDLFINDTTWGKGGVFENKGLISSIHGERPGWWGEEFFKLIREFKRNPRQYQEHLKLAYLCLSLGFQGQYRLGEKRGISGSAEQERKDIWQTLREEYDRVGFDRRLGPILYISSDTTNPATAIKPRLPLWACYLAVLGVLAAVLIEHKIRNGELKDRLALYFTPLPIYPLDNMHNRPTPIPPANLGLEKVVTGLDKDVELLSSGVRFAGSTRFDLGKYEIKPSFSEELEKIAQWLQNQPGTILVEGHTDATLPKSSVYMSNQELSKARANAVKAELVKHGVDENRIIPNGYGATRPMIGVPDPKDARHRRVEITLQSQGGY